jgi:chemotaxis protein histidine kinase CheA
VREFGGHCRVDTDPVLGGARFTLSLPSTMTIV